MDVKCAFSSHRRSILIVECKTIPHEQDARIIILKYRPKWNTYIKSLITLYSMAGVMLIQIHMGVISHIPLEIRWKRGLIKSHFLYYYNPNF